MNVSCPQCKTVFRIDPRKVPAEGVRARCSVCGGVFEVVAAAQAGDAGAAVPRTEDRAAEAPRPGTQQRPTQPSPSAPAAGPAQPAPPASPTEGSGPTAPPEGSGPTAPPEGPGSAAPPTPEEAESAAEAPTEPMPRAPAAPRAGPGRVFGQTDPEARARRLARALVSDLTAYHPEKQELGLRDNRLKELFREEIKKSWQEYVDQVGLDIAKGTPYFRDALNEILAKGRRVF